MPGKPLTRKKKLARIDRSDLPAPVMALPESIREVWIKFAEGKTYGQVANECDLTTGEVYRIVASNRLVFQLTAAARVTTLADASRAVLQKALAAGLDENASEMALERALKAATVVEKSLQHQDTITSDAAKQLRVTGGVTVNVLNVSRQQSSPEAPEAPVEEIDGVVQGQTLMLPVADTQPRRSRRSSRAQVGG